MPKLVLDNRPRVGRLHVLTDTRLQSRFSHIALAQMVFSVGADVVQIREKQPDPATFARTIVGVHKARIHPDQHVIINDFVPWVSAGAHGVHLGAEDMPVAEARATLGPGAIIGATVHSLTELQALKGQAIDYIGVGPVFGTTSKQTGLPPLGLDGLAEICRRSAFPVIAIGNIQLADVAPVMDAGAYGIAVLSGVCLAEDPRAATAAYLRKVRR